MKALSLWQPWAQLIVTGTKRIETRAWPAPAGVIGQRVAIHASLNAASLPREHRLPLGCIVGSVVIDRCVPMTRMFIEGLEAADPDEFALGDYARGRYAFMLSREWQLAEPVPLRGYQRFFHVDDAVLAGTLRL